MKDLAEQCAQLLLRVLGEGIAGEEETRKQHTHGSGHAHPIPQGDVGITQDHPEPVLDVLVFGVVGAVVEFFDGRFVPQVHEEDLALAEDLVDQLIEQVAPELEGDGLVTQAYEGILAELVEPHVQRQEDVLL